ncbi:hypothetical protein [Plastoroseomonas hellenica]|uniref:Uncharacterized protein n=1 Tax=Plastoroseomonas hellenica TaxID=2687306 RepID=A0ABS5F366_9PROT|nr:hypothetical protein [Plastoroseomonas hellenica]MBR0644482.1 hypothetical protein [Plastoroseomonas hellenica]MBR0666992.1 hypothetical protein [Plastoroseomonas hellenica]
MGGDDLKRRVERQRADAKGLSKLTVLWRGAREGASANGADCARNAKDPLRRLEPLRRRTGGARDAAGGQ